MSNLIKLRDKRGIERCLDCGRDWNIVKHASQGRCRGCARMKQHSEAKLSQRWSSKFNKCQNSNCPNTINGITNQPHNADGLCRSCYSQRQRYIDIEHSRQIESVRRSRPGFAERQKQFYDDWYKRNKEEHNRKTTQYGQEHPEWRNKCNAKYREEHREDFLASCRRHWHINKEQEHQRRREWRQNNPEIVRQSGRRRRARLAGSEGSFTLEEWMECIEIHNNRCYHCGVEFSETEIPTPDHLIPIIKGGSNYIYNIAPLCGKCNSSKCDKDLKDFDIEYYNNRFGNEQSTLSLPIVPTTP